VAVAVITSPLGVLMARRRDGNPPLTFPGGAVEPGETPMQAAIRETLEETGLAVRAVRVLGERVHPTTGRHIVYIAAIPTAGAEVRIADTDALADVQWLRPDTVMELLPDLFEPVVAYLACQL
jgi:8-oxo-dGTP diphosphatase